MIEIDDIKVGLEFKLPFREDEYEEDTARNRHRKIIGEYGCVLPMYKTDLKTIEGVKLLITPCRPIFKVVDIPMDYFKPRFEPSYLGSFIEVTCKGDTFRLSTKDVIERSEILEKSSRVSKKESFMSSKHSPDFLDVFVKSQTGDSKAFRDITNKMYDTFKQKNTDYGNSYHKIFKECGITYAYGHMAEKLERINSLRKNEAKVKGESMKDSLYDLANYAILTIMELEKTEK
ncbi:nucleotide modification associated domain-containing protein [Holdemanella sp.]|uniref:nucleotide modification associated domain-containing protein n=1 Tax=Holdemanella sp. TaxID=1971762 RepID=UPI003AF0FB5F